MPAEAPQTASPEKEPTATPELDLLFEQAKNCEDLSFVAEHLDLDPYFVFSNMLRLLDTNQDKEKVDSIIYILEQILETLKIRYTFSTVELMVQLALKLKSISLPTAERLSGECIYFLTTAIIYCKPGQQTALLGLLYSEFYNTGDTAQVFLKLKVELSHSPESYRELISYLCTIAPARYLEKLITTLPLPNRIKVPEQTAVLQTLITKNMYWAALKFSETCTVPVPDLKTKFISILVTHSKFAEAVRYIELENPPLSINDLTSLLKAYNEGTVALPGEMRTLFTQKITEHFHNGTIAEQARQNLYEALFPTYTSIEAVRENFPPNSEQKYISKYAITAARSGCDPEVFLFFIEKLTEPRSLDSVFRALESQKQLWYLSRVMAAPIDGGLQIKSVLLKAFLTRYLDSRSFRSRSYTDQEFSELFITDIFPKIPEALQLSTLAECITQSFLFEKVKLDEDFLLLTTLVLKKTHITKENLSDVVSVLEGVVQYAPATIASFSSLESSILQFINPECSVITRLRLRSLAQHYDWQEVLQVLDTQEMIPTLQTGDDLPIRELAQQGLLIKNIALLLETEPDYFIETLLPQLCNFADDETLTEILNRYTAVHLDVFNNIYFECKSNSRFEILYNNFEKLNYHQKIDVLLRSMSSQTMSQAGREALASMVEDDSEKFTEYFLGHDWLNLARTIQTLSQWQQERVAAGITPNYWVYTHLLAAQIELGDATVSEKLSVADKNEVYTIGADLFSEHKFLYLLSDPTSFLQGASRKKIAQLLRDKFTTLMESIDQNPGLLYKKDLDLKLLAEEFLKQNKYTLSDIALALYSQNSKKAKVWEELRSFATLIQSNCDPFELHYASPNLLYEKYKDIFPHEYLELIRDPEIPIRKFFTAWDEASISRTDIQLDNLQRILELGRVPDTNKYRAVELFNQCSIANFARYPVEVLKKQLESASHTKKVVLVMSSVDHNGSFYSQQVLIEDIATQLTNLGFSLSILEVFEPLRAVEKLDRMVHASHAKVQGLIIAAHGSREAIQLSSSKDGVLYASDIEKKHPRKKRRQNWQEFTTSVQGKISQGISESDTDYQMRVKRSSLREHILEKLTHDILVPGCPLLLISCSTGLPDGPAQKISRLTQGSAIGPANNTFIRTVFISKDPQTKLPIFNPEYGNKAMPVKAMQYSNGIPVDT